MTTEQTAAAPPRRRSVAERLDAVLEKVAPRARAFQREHGAWPVRPDAVTIAEPQVPEGATQEQVDAAVKAAMDAADKVRFEPPAAAREAHMVRLRADPSRQGQPLTAEEEARLGGLAASADTARRGAPYVIYTTPGDGRRIVVTKDDGDAVSGAGRNIEAAIAALEAKLS